MRRGNRRHDRVERTYERKKKYHLRLPVIFWPEFSVSIATYLTAFPRCLRMINTDYSAFRTPRRAVTTLQPSRCQERAWWPMRSEQRIVSDEEEQVIGVPTAQVTSNMPVLGPSADSTPLRGLLIAIFVLLSLPRCRCTDLGKSNRNSRGRVTSKFYDFRKVPGALLWPLPTSVTLSQSFSLSQSASSLCEKVAFDDWKSHTRRPAETASFREQKCFSEADVQTCVSRIYNSSEIKFFGQ